MLRINIAHVQREVADVFAKYEAALMANDVRTLNELFWNDPLTVRFADGEVQYGHEAIAAARQAWKPEDLDRSLTNVVITTYGNDMATTAAESLYRQSGRVGRQTQTWMRTDAGWKVVAAHVSTVT